MEAAKAPQRITPGSHFGEVGPGLEIKFDAESPRRDLCLCPESTLKDRNFEFTVSRD